MLIIPMSYLSCRNKWKSTNLKLPWFTHIIFFRSYNPGIWASQTEGPLRRKKMLHCWSLCLQLSPQPNLTPAGIGMKGQGHFKLSILNVTLKTLKLVILLTDLNQLHLTKWLTSECCINTIRMSWWQEWFSRRLAAAVPKKWSQWGLFC